MLGWTELFDAGLCFFFFGSQQIAPKIPQTGPDLSPINLELFNLAEQRQQKYMCKLEPWEGWPTYGFAISLKVFKLVNAFVTLCFNLSISYPEQSRWSCAGWPQEDSWPWRWSSTFQRLSRFGSGPRSRPAALQTDLHRWCNSWPLWP